MNSQTKDYELIENFVFSAEHELDKIFISRSNDLYLKLKNILDIFNNEKLSISHFQTTTGMGLDDISREKIDRIFAKLFLAETAAVRM